MAARGGWSMACVAQDHEGARWFRAGHGPYSAPVIADRGDVAWVVLVSFPAPPQVGDRFELAGTTWVITHAKDRLRGFVARALTQPGHGRQRPAEDLAERFSTG